jgi:hypothetical protein
LYAQKTPSSTSSTITTYEPFGSTEDIKNIASSDKNVIKWNASILSRGVFLLNYERAITDNFSLEVGAGVSYQDFLYGESKNINSETSSLMINGQTINDKTISPGFALEISPRYYPQSNDMDGFYFSPFARIREYNATITDPQFHNDSTKTYQTFKGTYNFGQLTTDYGLLIGYQTEVWDWYQKFTVDYYFGVSYRTNIVKDTKYNGSMLTIIDKQNSFPTILIGAKVLLFQF